MSALDDVPAMLPAQRAGTIEPGAERWRRPRRHRAALEKPLDCSGPFEAIRVLALASFLSNETKFPKNSSGSTNQRSNLKPQYPPLDREYKSVDAPFVSPISGIKLPLTGGICYDWSTL